MDARAQTVAFPDATVVQRPHLNLPSRTKWIALKRGIALSVAGALALLILTSILPPLVADQTDRAVVDAPAMLLTAPIAGEVTSLSITPGASLGVQANAAEIVNSRVDRSTLITLEGKYTDSGESLQAIRAKREADVRYVNALSEQIGKQSSIIEARYEEQIAELQAEIGSTQAAINEKKLVLDHQSQMVAKSVAAPEMSKAAQQQYAAARFQLEGVLAKLQQKQAQLDSARQQVFVGDDARDLAVLIQKKRDMDLDIERLTIEQTQLSMAVQDQSRLLDAERQRLTRLERSTVDAPGRGEVLNVNSSLGRHVSAGDTLARMVDCDASFVVAIFSYRQGADLSAGSRVSIDAGAAGTQEGTITEVLPKTSDKVDESYAVPFPQTERRELYVLIRPDSPIRAASNPTQSCDIGRWVTVTRAGGWVPTSSVVWKKAIRQLGNGSTAVAKLWRAARAGVGAAASEFFGVPRYVFDQIAALIERGRMLIVAGK